MRLQSDLSVPLSAEGERPSTIGGRTAIAGAIPVLLFILSLSLILLAGSASAGTETGEFCLKTAEAEIGLNASQNSSSSTHVGNGSNSSVSNNTASALRRSSEFIGAIASPNSISSVEVVLDISPSAAAYIEGAVNLNYDLFFSEGGEIVPVPEMARLLGDAGISSNDSLLIAGECLPCGGGPSPAFFTYWALKYLGHEKVRVLDGTIEDWKAAGLNISNSSATRTRTEYIPHIRPELLATYEYVVTGGAQIVDARPANAYELGSIPGAINIPYENVLLNDSMMPKEMLNEHFLDLDKNRSVVVYTNIGVEAALLWFALNDSGYDARLYTWRDWLENQPKFPYELAEVSAQPNPVKSGEATTITASFHERVERENSTQDSSSTVNSSANQELKLTVKGCATCGFGSPQGFANLDRKDGYVQIGSNRNAGQSSASSTNASDQSSSDGILRCTAVIYAPDGTEVTRTSLLETSGGRYMGIWNANVAPGVYKVSIVASLDGNAEAFTDVLQVEVTRKG